MPFADLGAEIIACAISVIAVLISFAMLRNRRGGRDVGPPSPPPIQTVDGVADVSRAVVKEAAERDGAAIADAVEDDHPASALSELVNARRRSR